MQIYKKGRCKMIIPKNHAQDYRIWAYCCASINRITEEINYCESGPIPAGVYFGFRYNGGSKAYIEQRKKRIPALKRKISRYAALRDKLSLKLDSPEKHLLTIEDMLNMIGNVIETTPRHGRKKSYRVLNKCSSDGSKVNDLDAYDLLALGYGKQP